ncbi:MAG: efflux RND transporter permease subunit, partial [Treponema sp.]|nr:efflux RND transporter permease subunit [Treponema sp.]
MKKSRTWFERRKASLCIISALCAMSLCAIIGLGENGRKPESLLYAVTIRHYGVDAAEMERTVAIPLEDAVSSIPGIAGVYGSSENSMTKVLVRFNGGAKGHYDALREAAQRVYEGLPQSAQRPEIQSAGSSLIPVWSAVVSVRDDAGDISALHIERILKPRLESLEGAGEVLVSGGGPPELIVTLDPEKAAALGLVPSSAAAVLAMNDALFSGGILAQGEREIIVSVDGRFDTGDSSSLGGLFIPLGEGRAVSLSEVAFITGRERRPDSLSRINGKKASVVSVMAGSGADLRKLSKNINREITDPSLPFTFNVLSDRGAEEAAALRSVFSAAAQGALMVAIIGFALSRRKLQGRKLPVNFPGVFCGLSVPVVCLVSAALLSACGLPLDRSVLAGIAAGLGTAIDSVILSSERFKRCKSYGEAGSSLRSLSGPLAAGAATTIAALLPIPAMANSGGQDDAAVIAVSIAVVTIAALALSLGPLPPLLLWNMDGKNGGLQKAGGKAKIGPVFRKGSGVFDKVAKRISRIAGRFLAVSVKCSVKRPWLVITAGLAVSACGLIVLCVKGTDTGSYGSGSSVYAHVEFEGGLLAEEADCLLAGFGESLAGGYGIVNAETTAKTGSGSVMISFDPKKTSAENVRDLARRIPFPGAFLFFPEAASKERHWEIKIFGDDSRRCREIAEETARSLAASPLVKERILNFKQGSLRMDLLPDREKMASLGLNFSLAADSVRRAVHGPVAYKRV